MQLIICQLRNSSVRRADVLLEELSLILLCVVVTIP